MSYGAPPTIPTELQQYSSYTTDPKWARKFTIIWCSALGFFVALSLPTLLLTLRRSPGSVLDGIWGVSEDFTRGYEPLELNEKGEETPNSKLSTSAPLKERNKVVALLQTISSLFRWTIPGVEVNFGQMILIIGYLVAVITCATMKVPLIDNPNRLGFLAVAQLPPIFLFATKNNFFSVISGFSSFSYEKLNFIHKWAGRGLFICATLHGALWIRNHLEYGLPIMGEYKETSGVAAFGVLCGIVFTSLRPVRRLAYQFFFIVHVLGYVAFFITLCYHTPYATPWIFPPLAFYGFDLALRMIRYRVKDAVLVPADKNMTLVHVRDCDAGWKAGQHVRLRVFFSGRILESHPFTILNAPRETSCFSQDGVITLAARVSGRWTHALNTYALEEQERLSLSQSCWEKETSDQPKPEVEVQVMLDGPYGGCSIDIASYEAVLLVAGGSGATFTLGLLDDLIGRVVRGERKGGEKAMRVEWAWCIRSFGCIAWFAPQLQRLARAAAGSDIDLHISIYVTCLCDPEAVPPIPNSNVSIYRPSVGKILEDLLTPPSSTTSRAEEAVSSEMIGEKLKWTGLGGGVAVCASGPESLVRETQNAVSSLGLRRGGELGGIGLHTELFAI